MADITYKVVKGLVRHRYKTEADWVLKDPVLLNGEIAITYYTAGKIKMKVGNGTAKWSELSYITADADALLEALKTDVAGIKAKKTLTLDDVYTTADSIPCGSTMYSNIENNPVMLADLMMEDWFPVIADDHQIATDVTFDGTALGAMFTQCFPAYAVCATNGTYIALRDAVVEAFKDVPTGTVYVTNTDNNVSSLYTVLHTDMTVTYNDADYVVPVYKYQNISSLTAEEKEALANSIGDLDEALAEYEERLEILEEIDTMKIVGYGDVPLTAVEFTSSDNSTMRTVNVFETGLPVSDTITVDTTAENISEADKALLAKYIDPEIATSEDTVWINQVISEYVDFVEATNTTLHDVGDTYIILPTTADEDYGMATFVGYEEDGAIVYKWVYHRSNKVALEELEAKIDNAKKELTETINEVKETYATKVEVDNKIAALGTLFNIVDVIDTIEELPGYTDTTGKVMDGITEAELATLQENGFAVDPGDVYVVGDDTVDNKAEYVWLYNSVEATYSWTDKPVLPYEFKDGSAVVYNNEIHILGGIGNKTAHYKYNGTEWVEVSTLPYEFYAGSVVVYNNEIHILGSGAGSNNTTAHYKYNGTEWVEVSTLPYDFEYGSAVVYNNEIHILGGIANSNAHYKYNGTEWVEVSTLSYDFNYNFAVVYNNEIHVLGGTYDEYYVNITPIHYKYNGTEWVEVSTLPYIFEYGSAVVYNNEIHLLGGDRNGTNHYKYNGTEWVEVSTLPYDFEYGSAVVYNNEIHILGGFNNKTAFAALNITEAGNVYWFEYLGKISEIDMKNYYNKEAIDALLNGVAEDIAGLGNVMDYKGVLATTAELPVLVDCDFINGYTIANDDQFAANKETLEGLLATNDIEVGDVYFVGTNVANTVGYTFISSENEDGSVTYRWQPLGKIYDSDIADLRTRVSAIEALTILNINNVVPSVANIPGGLDTMYYTEDTVNYPSANIYPESANVPVIIKQMPDLPMKFVMGNAIVFDNEIHIIDQERGGNHYKYNGTEWVYVDKVSFRAGGTAVYNDKIHAIGFNSYYTYDNENGWVQVNNNISDVSASSHDTFANTTVFNNELYVVSRNNNCIYKLNDETNDFDLVIDMKEVFTQLLNSTNYGSLGIYTVNNGVSDVLAIVYKSTSYSSTTSGRIITWDGTNFTKLNNSIPNYEYSGGVVYNGALYYNEYKYEFTTTDVITTYIFNRLSHQYRSSRVVYNGELHILGGLGSTESMWSIYTFNTQDDVVNAVIAYNNNVFNTVLKDYDIGDIIYIAPDIEASTVTDINVDAAVPYMLLGYSVDLPMYPNADDTQTAATDAKDLMVYKWVRITPSAAYMTELEGRVSAAEVLLELHTEKVTDHEARIKVLENAGYATITYVDEKVKTLGQLLNIKGVLESEDELPGYAQNENVLTGVTEEEVAAIEEVIDTSLKVGDTYLVNNDNNNKIEYTWVPIEVKVPNPDYVDAESTPDEPETINQTQYRWEKLGSVSGLDLENYYTKILADETFLRKDDPTVLKTDDNLIIDGSDDFDGAGNIGGTGISDAVVTFEKATKFEALDNTSSLGVNLGRVAQYYDEIGTLKKKVTTLEEDVAAINKNLAKYALMENVTITLSKDAWVLNETTTKYEQKSTLSSYPVIGNVNISDSYSDEDKTTVSDAINDISLDVKTVSDSDVITFIAESVPTIDIKLDVAYCYLAEVEEPVE